MGAAKVLVRVSSARRAFFRSFCFPRGLILKAGMLREHFFRSLLVADLQLLKLLLSRYLKLGFKRDQKDLWNNNASNAASINAQNCYFVPLSRSTGTAFVSRHLLLKLIIPAAYEVRSIHDTKDNINFKLACLFRLLMGTFESGSQDFIKQEALSFLE